MQNQKVCIIGAGSSGIVAAKAMYEAGIPFDCFEKGSNIGGNWLYENDNGQSAAYQSLHINTSKQLMAFSDFPMPDHYPDYPGHKMVYQYFEAYIDKFGFRQHIIFNTTVLRVEKLADNNYKVYTNKFEPKEYTAVLVANGHHWSAKYATFEGNFSGTTSHSHHYKTYSGFEGKKVLLIGIGNSAMDIACELTTVAESVTVSTRSSAHVLPKYLFGKPTDHLSRPPLAYMPLAIRRMALSIALKLNVGNQANYGLPRPKRKLLSEHPTISQEFLNKVGHGKIAIKPNIQKLNGGEVIFADGSSANFDHIIYCTGYNVEFPFFDKTFFVSENNELNLYEFVVDPQNPGLYFIGFLQPLGAVMPLAELQAVWVAKIIKGEITLPAKEKMLQSIYTTRQKMLAQYDNTPRHTMQVDFYPYRRKMQQLIKGG